MHFSATEFRDATVLRFRHNKRNIFNSLRTQEQHTHIPTVTLQCPLYFSAARVLASRSVSFVDSNITVLGGNGHVVPDVSTIGLGKVYPSSHSAPSKVPVRSYVKGENILGSATAAAQGVAGYAPYPLRNLRNTFAELVAIFGGYVGRIFNKIRRKRPTYFQRPRFALKTYKTASNVITTVDTK